MTAARPPSQKAEPLSSTPAPPIPSAPDPAVPAAASLAALCGDALGVQVDLAEAPTPLDNTHGPSSFGFALAPGPIPPAWSGPLQVRVDADPARLRAEADALGLCAHAGIAAPRLLVDATDPTVLDTPAIVLATPRRPTFIELIAAEPHNANALLQAMGHAQLALHDIAVDPDQVRIPRVSVPDIVATLGGDASAGREAAWLLDRHPAPTGPPVLCHGGFQPLVLSGDPTRDEPVTIGNFSSPGLAEREYDVAFGLVAFWAAPFFTTTRSEKAGMKMIRDSITKIYRLSYEAEHPLDDARLTYWQAFHCHVGAARATAPDRHGAFERADGVVPSDLPAALRKRFAALTKR